ncbi:hypothetical protein AALP_AA3G247400 [Arabis alpina]|uniref:Uncharacterized protein n=1 Tax=Arabis alpina TaxID=50452 RepID=A0A087HBF6_ARAAL|nr:hypothetical protein AALP_AA3G247400 [Arabis alpina]
MTDERRIADPKDVAPRDLEEGEIQAEGDTNKDQTARDDPPPAGTARADLPGEKSKETPRASSLLPELLQNMSATLDALLESAERQNITNRTITDELRSIGADVRAQPLEPSLFRKPAARIDPVALNFTTPGGSSSRPRHQNLSTAANDGRSALVPQARREKAKVGDEPIDLDNDDEDLPRRVVPETIFTETMINRQGINKAKNDDPRYIALHQFSTVRDDGSVRRVARNAVLPEEEATQRTTTRTKHADPQRKIQQRFSAFDDDDLARRVVPDTIFTETAKDRHGTTKARNDDPRYVASQQFSTFGDHGPVRRVACNANLQEEEVARRTTIRQKHADPQRMTQQRFPAFDDEIDPGYARHISEEEENIEWAKLAEVAEVKQAAIRAQHDEMAEFRASLNKTTAELKTIRSQMHRATSKAP